MSDLTLPRATVPAVPASLVQVLKDAFSATPLAIAIRALRG